MYFCYRSDRPRQNVLRRVAHPSRTTVAASGHLTRIAAGRRPGLGRRGPSFCAPPALPRRCRPPTTVTSYRLTRTAAGRGQGLGAADQLFVSHQHRQVNAIRRPQPQRPIPRPGQQPAVGQFQCASHLVVCPRARRGRAVRRPQPQRPVPRPGQQPAVGQFQRAVDHVFVPHEHP